MNLYGEYHKIYELKLDQVSKKNKKYNVKHWSTSKNTEKNIQFIIV